MQTAFAARETALKRRVAELEAAQGGAQNALLSELTKAHAELEAAEEAVARHAVRARLPA